MLLEEFLTPMGITQQELANAIHVPYQRINEIVRGRRGVTPSTALRLAKFFGVSADFWLNLQLRWDLYNAQQTEGSELERIETRRLPAQPCSAISGLTVMHEEKMPPVHPGEILIEDLMKPLGITQYRLAKEMNVYPRKVNEIVQDKSSDHRGHGTRLARFFGTSPEVWMNLQAHYDLEAAKDDLDERVDVRLCRLPGRGI